MQIGHFALTLELKYFSKHFLQAKLLQLGHDKGSFTEPKQIIQWIKSTTLSDIFRLMESFKLFNILILSLILIILIHILN